MSRNGLSPKAVHGLTKQQRLFVEEYLKCLSPSEAARKAGYKHPHVRGSKLMVHPKIKPLIQNAITVSAKKSGVEADEVIEQLRNIIFRDPAKFQNDDGSLITNMHQLPLELRMCIESIKAKQRYDPETGDVIGIEIEYKLSSRIDALKLLMQNMGMLEPKEGGNENELEMVPWDDLYGEPEEVRGFIEQRLEEEEDDDD